MKRLIWLLCLMATPAFALPNVDLGTNSTMGGVRIATTNDIVAAGGTGDVSKVYVDGATNAIKADIGVPTLNEVIASGSNLSAQAIYVYGGGISLDDESVIQKNGTNLVEGYMLSDATDALRGDITNYVDAQDALAWGGGTFTGTVYLSQQPTTLTGTMAVNYSNLLQTIGSVSTWYLRGIAGASPDPAWYAASNATASTNFTLTFPVTSSNEYFATWIFPSNTITTIQGGQARLDLWCNLLTAAGGKSLVYQPELYVSNAGMPLIEYSDNADLATPGTTLARQQHGIAVPFGTNVPITSYVMLRLKSKVGTLNSPSLVVRGGPALLSALRLSATEVPPVSSGSITLDGQPVTAILSGAGVTSSVAGGVGTVSARTQTTNTFTVLSNTGSNTIVDSATENDYSLTLTNSPFVLWFKPLDSNVSAQARVSLNVGTNSISYSNLTQATGWAVTNSGTTVGIFWKPLGSTVWKGATLP